LVVVQAFVQRHHPLDVSLAKAYLHLQLLKGMHFHRIFNESQAMVISIRIDIEIFRALIKVGCN
jgi:hypothetical protein